MSQKGTGVVVWCSAWRAQREPTSRPVREVHDLDSSSFRFLVAWTLKAVLKDPDFSFLGNSLTTHWQSNVVVKHQQHVDARPIRQESRSPLASAANHLSRDKNQRVEGAETTPVPFWLPCASMRSLRITCLQTEWKSTSASPSMYHLPLERIFGVED